MMDWECESLCSICIFRYISLPKINGLIPELCYIKRDKIGALDKLGYSV